MGGGSAVVIEMPKIDVAKCDGCGLCVSVCKCQALVLVGGVVAIIESKLCGWCLQCELICPRGAISCPYEIVIE
jgi:MinD superfamily P-loop ATPase